MVSGQQWPVSPPIQLDSGLTREHDPATDACRVDTGAGAKMTADHSTDGVQPDEPKQNPDCGDVERANRDRPGGPVTENHSGSRSSSRRDITALFDQHAEIIRNAGMQRENPVSVKMPTVTAEAGPESSHYGTMLRKTAKQAEQTIVSSRRNVKSSIGAASVPMAISKDTWQNSRSVAGTDEMVRRVDVESSTKTGDGTAGKSHAHTSEYSSIVPDTWKTRSSAPSAGKISAVVNTVDRYSTFKKVYPSVAAVTKPNKYVTNIPQYATNGAKTEVAKTSQNVSPAAETSTAFAKGATSENNFRTGTAKHSGVATKNGAVSVSNAGANSDQTAGKKSPSDTHSLMPSATHTYVRPETARTIKTKTSRSQVFTSVEAADKISTDAYASTLTAGKDDVSNAKVEEALITDTAADTVSAARKNSYVCVTRQRQNSLLTPNRSVNSSTTEPASRIAKTSRLPLPRRLGQNAPSTLNDAVSVSSGESLDTDDNDDDDDAQSVASRLVRVDRMVRSALPFAPANIRSTGVATPALQAHQKLANTETNKARIGRRPECCQRAAILPRSSRATAEKTAAAEQLNDDDDELFQQSPLAITTRKSTSRELK